MNNPWDNNPEMRSELEDAGWRYAQLIGIVDVVPHDIPEHIAQMDKARYSHFIRRDSQGRPIWDDSEAIIFVQELTGYERRICALWLDYDWNDDGDDAA